MHSKFTPVLPFQAVAYLDSIAVLTNRPPGPYLIDAMMAHAGDAFKDEEYEAVPGYVRLWVHQPRAGVYDLLEQLHKPRVQQVHVAFDIPAASRDEAAANDRYLNSRITQRWRRSEEFNIDRNTRYSSRDPRRKVTLAGYHDKPDRFDEHGRPCAHLEYRLVRCGTCRRRGLASVEAVRRLDPVAWLRRELVLGEVDTRQLGRQFNGRPKAKHPDLRPGKRQSNGWGQPYDRDLKTGMHIAQKATASREAGHRTEAISTQAVRDAFADKPWFNPRSAIKKLDPAAYLHLHNLAPT